MSGTNLSQPIIQIYHVNHIIENSNILPKILKKPTNKNTSSARARNKNTR